MKKLARTATLVAMLTGSWVIVGTAESQPLVAPAKSGKLLTQQPLPSAAAASSAAKPPTATPPAETVTGSPFGVEIVKKGPFQVAAGTGYSQVVYCRNSKKVVSGGIQAMPTYGKISQSYPPSDSSWYIVMDNEGGPALTVYFYAVCIPSQ
jgi:hypothetical protein